MITALTLASVLIAQSAPLAGPQPYPLTTEQRRREEERAVAAANSRNPAPRIGLSASQMNDPAGDVVLGYSGEQRNGRWNTEFYIVGRWAPLSSEHPTVFVRNALDATEGMEQVRWADSRTCPGLVDAMLRANTLSMPQFILPLDEESRARIHEMPFSSPPGPGSRVFWSPARGPMAYSLQFAAWGGPWNDWADAVDEVLEPCWQNDRPVRPADPD